METSAAAIAPYARISSGSEASRVNERRIKLFFKYGSAGWRSKYK
jgi:hypothetical protein